MSESIPTTMISFRKSQRDFAEEVQTELRERGLEPWLEDFAPGQFWRKELLHKLQTVDCCIPILSPDYVKSEFCRMEAFVAKSYNRTILPAMVEICFDEIKKHEETKGLEDIFLLKFYADRIVGLPVDRSEMFDRLAQGALQFRDTEDQSENVYVSYSGSETGVFATEIAMALEREGVTSWVATQNIRVGENWRIAQTRAMMRAHTHVVVLDESIMSSSVLRTEILLSEARDLKLYTIFAPKWERGTSETGNIIDRLNAGDQTYRRLTDRQFFSSDQTNLLVQQIKSDCSR